MREIKFRAWDKQYKQMLYTNDEVSFVCLGLDKLPSGKYKEGCRQEPKCCEEPDSPIGCAFNNCQLFNYLQYTGLKDKNGKEIYEGI